MHARRPGAAGSRCRLPPALCAMRCTMVSPRPLPLPLAFLRQKRPQACAHSSGVRPGPRSRTLRCTAPSSARVSCTCTGASPWWWCRALSSRLVMAQVSSDTGRARRTGVQACGSAGCCVQRTCACAPRSASWRCRLCCSASSSACAMAAPWVCGASALRALSSWARSSSCSRVRCMCAMPWPACSSACRVAAGAAWFASSICATCTWVLMAVSGVRSSCAASALQRRSCARAASMRASRSLRLATSGASSSVSRPACTGVGSCGGRCSSAWRSRCSGRSVCVVMNQVSPTMAASARAKGRMSACQAERTSAARVSRRSAVATRRPSSSST